MFYCTGQLHESVGATGTAVVVRDLAKIICKSENMSFGTYRKGKDSSEALQNVQMWM